MGEKLRPCPFCGSPAHIVWGAKRRVYGSQETVEGACVYCETCNVRMFSTAKHLITEMWNRRADDDQLHEYDKALKTMGDLNDGQSEKIAKLKAQLRAQEPRVLTVEEIQRLPHGAVIWEECAEYDTKTITACMVINEEGKCPCLLDDAGQMFADGLDLAELLHRCLIRFWTAKPNDEQREAVPWESLPSKR